MIRLAGRDDVGHIQHLFNIRDGEEWDRGNVEWLFLGLDPQHCVAWLAFDGDRVVGLSAMLLRNLRWDGQTRRVGYWTNLYVLPSHRHLMLYPRLPLAMFHYVKAHDLAFLYTAVRRRELAASHLRIGFSKLGEIAVLFKPLRPVRLVTKAWKWPAPVSTFGLPVDAAWRRLVAPRRSAQPPDLSIETLDPSSSAGVSDLVRMLNRSGDRRVAQVWTDRMLANRYRQTPDGGRSRLWLGRRQGRPVAAVAYCTAVRGPKIIAGVIMDVIADSIDDVAVASMIAEVHRHAAAQGCDVMLYLNGLGAAAEALFRRLGYRTSSEIYDVLIWPREMSKEAALQDIAHWRFGFGDHDAF
jgi:hypothetical protein